MIFQKGSFRIANLFWGSITLTLMYCLLESKLNGRQLPMKQAAALIRKSILIFLCFLLTSTAWIGWEYHLSTQISYETTDIISMVAGYLLQALGLWIFSIIIKKQQDVTERIFYIALAAHIVCMIPAVFTPYAAGTIAFGLFMNLFCGLIAGYYLYRLTTDVAPERRAASFGIGYGLSILVSWLISLIWEKSASSYLAAMSIICLIISVLCVIVCVRIKKGTSDQKKAYVPPKRKIDVSVNKRFLYLCFLMLVIFGIINNCGFSFP